MAPSNAAFQTPRTILHVDDDPSMLRLVSSRLGDEGYTVISVEDSREAMAILKETGCRLAILDIDMPHIDGMELLKQVKAFNANIQVIMLTGLVGQLTALDSLSGGAEYCLFKPVHEPKRLIQTVDLTFRKLDMWRETLHELRDRRHATLAKC